MPYLYNKSSLHMPVVVLSKLFTKAPGYMVQRGLPRTEEPTKSSGKWGREPKLSQSHPTLPKPHNIHFLAASRSCAKGGR